MAKINETVEEAPKKRVRKKVVPIPTPTLEEVSVVNVESKKIENDMVLNIKSRAELRRPAIKFELPKVDEDPKVFIEKLKIQLPILLILVVLLTAGLTFTITKQFQQDVVDQTSFIAKISGGVALTEADLKEVVSQLKTSIYWAGPMDGAKYTINATTPGQTYVRYLPNGEGVNDLSAKYRVIGTYDEKDAYTATLAAGNEANAVSFTTPEGSVVHYNKSAQSNVYVAFQGKNYQIEVFDPSSKTAIALATEANKIRLIK